MQIIHELELMEKRRLENIEINDTTKTINAAYKEWKKVGRRKNASNIVTTTTNKVSHIDPNTIPLLPEAVRLKLVTVLMRAMDIPPWKDIETKRVVYRKLQPLLKILQHYNPNTGTGGSLLEVVATRLSAHYSDKMGREVFVTYEPKTPKSYLTFIFGDEKPKNVVRMGITSFPEEFSDLLKLIKRDYEKVVEHLNKSEDGEVKTPDVDES